MSNGIVDTASTYGWDTVFALHIADVNKAIRNAGTSPKAFEVDDPEDRVSAAGQFGAWQLATGGDSDLVRMDIPIRAVTLQLPESKEVLADATLKVDVRLDFLHNAAGDSPSGGQPHHLKVRTTPIAPGEKIATVAEIIYPGSPPSFLVQAALRGLMESWLNQNLGDFDHVFATVNLNQMADQGDFQWIQPTDVAYAYSDLGTATDGALGVLCMTQGRSSKGLIQQLSSAAIPASQRAGFLISKERLIAQMLLPSMTKVFKGTKSEDFQLSETGDSVVNATDNIRFQVTDKDGKSYTAYVVSLSMRIEGTELLLDVHTKTNVSPGIRAHCRTQSFLGIKLITKKDGTQTLGFADARPAQVDHWTDADQGIKIAEEILGIVAIIAALVATVVTGGAAIGVAVIVIAVVAGVAAGTMMVTDSSLEMVHKNDAPSIDAMMLNATAPIVWADSKDFKLGLAQLSDSLQLAGEPLFVDRPAQIG